jgi:hypothetical protein
LIYGAFFKPGPLVTVPGPILAKNRTQIGQNQPKIGRTPAQIDQVRGTSQWQIARTLARSPVAFGPARLWFGLRQQGSVHVAGFWPQWKIEFYIYSASRSTGTFMYGKGFDEEPS